MIDEPQAPEVQDTPDAPESGPAEPTPAPQEQPQDTGQMDWEQRYKDLQSAYTQTSQEAAQLRQAQEQAEATEAMHSALQDPDTQQEAYQALVGELGVEQAHQWLSENGYQVEGDQQPGYAQDPRVDQLLASMAEERELAESAQIADGLRSQLDGLAGQSQLTDQAKGFILNYAVQQWDGEGDIPVEDAFKAYMNDRDAAIKDYRDTKRNQPSPPLKGDSGSPAQSTSDRASRLALANQIAEEAAQSA